MSTVVNATGFMDARWFPAVSNVFLLAPIVVSVYRKYFAEAIVYLFTMVISIVYHVCREDAYGPCSFVPDLFARNDLVTAVFSAYVTALRVPKLSVKFRSLLYVFGLLLISPSVRLMAGLGDGLQGRTFPRVIQLGMPIAAIAFMLIVIVVSCCRNRSGIIDQCMNYTSSDACRDKQILEKGSSQTESVNYVKLLCQTNTCYPIQWVVGIVLAIVSTALFFIQAADNYNIVHSFFHILGAIAYALILPYPDSYLTVDEIRNSCSNIRKYYAGDHTGEEIEPLT